MNPQQLNIVFMGAGLNPLSEHIIQSGVVGIIDGGKPKKRLKALLQGLNPANKSIKKLARRNNVPYLNYESASQEERSDFLKGLNTNILMVFSLSHLLPKSFIDIPKTGTFNFHPSLLPDYKGPHPNFWVLKNQEKYTGITLHWLDEGEDTGPIAYQSMVEISQKDTMSSLLQKQMEIGKHLYNSFLQSAIKNDIPKFIQEKGNEIRARRINKDNYFDALELNEKGYVEITSLIHKTFGLAKKAAPQIKREKIAGAPMNHKQQIGVVMQYEGRDVIYTKDGIVYLN